MKNQRKMLILAAAMISMIGVSIGVTAAPVFGDITLAPAAPTALSTFTVSVSISGETPSEVRIIVEECNEVTGVCHDKKNVSMTEVAIDSYSADVTLTYDDTTYITYWVSAQANGVWSESEKKNVTLSTGTTDGKKTPGFELALLMGAVGISMFLVLSRKRWK